MPKLKLTYFDIQGGRAEAARLAMVIGGIDFEDRRVAFKEWPALKSQTPFHAIPVLEVDGTAITQSNTISRYVGKLANLYPTDPWQAALCDETMDAVEDITARIVVTFDLKSDAEKKAAREKLADGPISQYLRQLQAQLERRGGKYFADNRLTVADLRVFVWIRHLRSGNLDHVPKDLPDRVAPGLVAHAERISAHPKISAYYQSPSLKKN